MRTKSWERRALILGPSLILAVLMSFHPWPYDNYPGKLAPVADWWITLHTIQFVLFPFVSAGIWRLTDQIKGIDVALSRAGAVTFAICYGLGDVLAGVATGILAQRLAGPPSGDQTALIAAIAVLFQAQVTRLGFLIGVIGWGLALAGAAIALWRAGAPRLPLILLAVPAYLIIGFDHAAPYGALAFGSLFAIALWLELHGWRSRPKTQLSAAPQYALDLN